MKGKVSFRKFLFRKFFKRLFQKHYVVSGVCVLVVLLSVIAGTTMVIKAEEPENATKRYKYYTSIQIENGDTLWDIAKEYIDTTDCSIQEYIAEVKRMNGLTTDKITAGCNLIVFYYSDVYKR